MSQNTKNDMGSLRLRIKSDAGLNSSLGKYFTGANKTRMGPPTLHWGSLEIDGNKAGSAAMSAALLTVIKGSYRHVKVYQAVDAELALKLDKGSLPEGFYVLSGSGKIAAGLFPLAPEGASFREEPNKAAEAFKRMSAPGGALASKVEPGAFCSDLRFDFDKLFDNARNFALALMTRKNSAKESYESFGFAASTTMMEEGGIWSERSKKGYPAFVDLGDAPMGSLATANNYEITFLKCMGLPIHNHCGYSLINNVRELLTAKEREPERRKIFNSLMDKWLEARMTETSQRDDQVIQAAGVDDEDGTYWKIPAGVAHLSDLRDKSNQVGRTSSIGSERQMVCNPNCTSYFNDGSSKMIGSLDFALVDGQHSSIDYAILASAVDVQARGGPPEEWLGHDKGAESSSPDALRDVFEKMLPLLAQEKGMAKDQWSKEQHKELWQDFAKFCRGATTTIRVTQEANPSNQISKVNQVNNHRAQNTEAMAMLERKDEILEFVELVNEESIRQGSSVMLVQTKSLMSNPDYAGAASASVIEFERIFPALYAVGRTQDASRATGRDSSALFGAGAEGDIEIAEQLSTVLGVRSTEPKMDNLVKRTRALVDFVSKFKGRELKLAEASLGSFFGKKASERGLIDGISGMVADVKINRSLDKGGVSYNREGFRELAVEESMKYREKWGPRFDAFSAFIKTKVRLFAVGDEPYELERSTRARFAYSIFERALLLTQAVQTGESISHVMSTDLCENVMISVSRGVNKKKFGTTGTECADEIKAAIERIKDLVLHHVASKDNNFNSAREMLLAQIKAFDSARLRGEPGDFNLKGMAPEALAILIDAMPSGKLAESLALEVCKKHDVPYDTKGSELGDKIKERRVKSEHAEKAMREVERQTVKS